MTTINSLEDFLRALAENPHWKEAVRAQLLGEDLLQLPARFDTFVEEQKQHNDRIDAFVEQMTAFVKEQRRVNDRMDRRMDTFNNDIGQVKGGHARWSTIHEAPSIVLGLNLERSLGLKYVRDVTMAELAAMAHNAAGGGISTNELRSFSRADLVIEVEDASGDTCYLTVEASFTATQRDASRAMRNAALLTRFTGQPAHPIVSSVRNDRNSQAEIAAGNVWWHELEERDMEVE